MQNDNAAFDISAVDVCSLNWVQRDALIRRLIERAHMERTQAIRRLFGRLRRLMIGEHRTHDGSRDNSASSACRSKLRTAAGCVGS